jgi:hypothetical protein
MNWQGTATQVQGYARALRDAGLMDRVLRHASDAARAALENPTGARRHEASTMLDLYDAIQRAMGVDGLERLTEAMMFQTLGKVVAPLVNVTLALFGTGPATVLSRFHIGLPQAMTGVTSAWEPGSTATTGALLVDFQMTEPVPPTLEPVLRGAIRYVASLSSGRVTIGAWVHARPGAVRFPLSWSERS